MIRIDEKFNWARVLIGGTIGGIGMNLVSFISAIPQLSPNYEFLLDRKYYEEVPHIPYLIIKSLGVIILGILLGWLYAVARHRLGRGARTALIVGVVVGFIATVPSALYQATWNPVPMLSPLWIRWLITGWIEVIIGTFIAAAAYSEDDDEEGED